MGESASDQSTLKPWAVVMGSNPVLIWGQGKLDASGSGAVVPPAEDGAVLGMV